ncbi:hypothetical protein [Streptomyces sp. NPDC047718]|uniref:hypothetical protein n=1 Tax=Streptomyces sp. NPDC047718 TaxID=3155479 RepID=UPI0033C9EAC9
MPGLVRPAALPQALVPVAARFHGPAGGYIGEPLAWTEDGATPAGLEYAWVGDEIPTVLPPAEPIRLTVR